MFQRKKNPYSIIARIQGMFIAAVAMICELSLFTLGVVFFYTYSNGYQWDRVLLLYKSWSPLIGEDRNGNKELQGYNRFDTVFQVLAF